MKKTVNLTTLNDVAHPNADLLLDIAERESSEVTPEQEIDRLVAARTGPGRPMVPRTSEVQAKHECVRGYIGHENDPCELCDLAAAPCSPEHEKRTNEASPWFARRHPAAGVWVVERDDGERICEAIASSEEKEEEEANAKRIADALNDHEGWYGPATAAAIAAESASRTQEATPCNPTDEYEKRAAMWLDRMTTTKRHDGVNYETLGALLAEVVAEHRPDKAQDKAQSLPFSTGSRERNAIMQGDKCLGFAMTKDSAQAIVAAANAHRVDYPQSAELEALREVEKAALAYVHMPTRAALLAALANVIKVRGEVKS